MSKLQNNTTSLQNLLEQVNALPEAVEQAVPSISVDALGLITATAGSRSAIYQLAFQPAKIITPTTASQIAVSSGYYTGGDITIVGDSNLVAENIKSGVSIFGVNGTFGGSGNQNQSGNEDVIINRTISEYTNDRVESIGACAFYECPSLTTVSFPNCTTIGEGAFNYCSSLTTVSFPNCTTIGQDAFNFCTSLTTVSFPNCTSIGKEAFYYCRRLTTVSFPNCTSIGESAFASCTSLTTVSFPNCTNIEIYGFRYCSKLTTVSFPSCRTIGSCAFYACSNLTTVSFPKCTTISSNAFYGCSKLTTASFPWVNNIESYAFCRCVNLKSLYLTDSLVCKLSHSNAFSSTPIGGYSKSAGTYGSIYVPASLLSSYQRATNWTYFSSRFVGI